MAVQRFKILATDINDNSRNQYDITAAMETGSDAGIEATMDTFNFSISLKSLPTLATTADIPFTADPSVMIGKYMPDVEDQVLVYFSTGGNPDPSASSANLVMDGKIDTVSVTLNEQGRLMHVSGVNKLEALLNRVQPSDFTDAIAGGTRVVSSVTATTIVATGASFSTNTIDGEVDKTILIKSGTALDKTYHVSGVSGTTLTVDTGNPQADGVVATDTFVVSWTSFKAVQKFLNDINVNNEQQNIPGQTVKWVPIVFSTSNPKVKADGTPLKPIEYAQPYKPVFQQIEEISRGTYTGDGTYLFYLDVQTNNFIWKPRPTVLQTKVFSEGGAVENSEAAENIKAEYSVYDVINALIIHAGDDNNSSPIFTIAYNLDSIGKTGFKWKYVAYTEAAKNIKFHNSGISNEDLRSKATLVAKAWGQSVVSALGAPRWKITADIRGTNTYTLGNIHKFHIPSVGWLIGTQVNNLRELRITNIRNTFSRNGWMTTIVGEEDEEVALRRFSPNTPFVSL